MTQNKYSTEGMLEDMIRSYVQMCATELHEKTNLERINAELEREGITYAEFEKQEKLVLENLESYTQIRRATQKSIFDLAGGKGDIHEWCKVKHLAMSMYTMFETYQASDSNMAVYDLYLAINKEFIKTMTKFLGLPITDCSACFTDFLKGSLESEDDNDLPKLSE